MARHALLIGVSRFDDTRLAALNAPANDVTALGSILRDPARGGFDSVEISVDEDCQRVRDRVAALFDVREPDDLVLLYYSGHGILRRGNRLFLATPASDLDDPRPRSVPASEIREQMDECRAQQQVLLLDCCHSGAFAEGAKSGGAVPAVTDGTFLNGAEGRYVLTASDSQQFAWDGADMAEGRPADRRLSRFTSWLVDGLGTGAAAPDEPDITMSRLFRYVVQRARTEGAPATPQSFVERATGELVIGRNPAAAGEAEIARLAAGLAAADWQARLQAVEALARLARRPHTSAGAVEALAEQLAGERDFKVRTAILRALQRPAEVEDEPASGPSRTAAGKPEPAPPSRTPAPNEIPSIMSGLPWGSAPSPEPRSATSHAVPDPPPRMAETTAGPVASPDLIATLKPKEIEQLTAAGIPGERWPSLPAAVIDLVRVHAAAVRNGRILVWTAWICAVLDLGVINLTGSRDPSAGGALGIAVWQVIVGFLALVPGPWRASRPTAKLPDEFAALARRMEVVRFRYGKVSAYERGRLRHGGWVLLVAGLVTCVIVLGRPG